MCDSVWPHRWQPTRLLSPWDSPGKNAGVGCHCLLQCMRACSVASVRLCTSLWTAAHQASMTTGFSRQEYWNGVPFPSPWTGTWIYFLLRLSVLWIEGSPKYWLLSGKQLHLSPLTIRTRERPYHRPCCLPSSLDSTLTLCYYTFPWLFTSNLAQ